MTGPIASVTTLASSVLFWARAAFYVILLESDENRNFISFGQFNNNATEPGNGESVYRTYQSAHLGYAKNKKKRISPQKLKILTTTNRLNYPSSPISPPAQRNEQPSLT